MTLCSSVYRAFFWTTIYAFGVRLLVTIAVSLTAKPRPEDELVGLVYSLTPREDSNARRGYRRLALLGACVLGAAVALNIIFW